MKVVFRVDASVQMGSGHVMRCLTLARALRERKYQCIFISRELPGNLNAFIRDQDFELYVLPMGQRQGDDLFHSHWLGASQGEDIEACCPLLAELQPRWLVVDHYALDRRWEEAVVPRGCRVFAIDDLADRYHQCDLLLDQNLGKESSHYRLWVPNNCHILTGPAYALLRPEFAELRASSLKRRHTAPLRNVLVTMGGVDQYNYTGTVLEALKRCDLPQDIRFTVVMGATSPHLESVRQVAASCSWPTEVLCGISDMAQRMGRADLVIGAGGSTSWERCCLGVPTLLVVLAENQAFASQALKQQGAVEVLDVSFPIHPQLQTMFKKLSHPHLLKSLADKAARLCDGKGTERVLDCMD